MLDIKRVFTGFVLATVALSGLPISAIAGGMQHQPKKTGHSQPSSSHSSGGGLSGDTSQNANTSQQGVNINSGIGNQSITNNSTQYQQDNSGQIHNTSSSSSNSNASAASNNNSKGSDVNLNTNTYSKTDARSDGGVGQIYLPSTTNYTGNSMSVKNICGVETLSVNITPQTNSFAAGLNIFGVGGGHIASSRQKFNTSQESILALMASNLSMNTAQAATLLSNPQLARPYLVTAIAKNYMSMDSKMKREVAISLAKADADNIIASNNVDQNISSAVRLCSIYKTTPTIEQSPVMQQPPIQPIEVPPVYQGPGKN